MNHNDFREIIDDVPETGADTNTGTAGSRQPGSADNGVPAGNAAHGAQTGSEAPRAEDVAEHESTSGTGEVMQSSASDDTDRNQDTEYEDICYICRRPEHIAGKMIRIPNNICICQDCMQKTFDSMNGSGFSMDDMMNMNMGRIPNISMINLSDLQGGLPNNQKLKKKKPKAQSEPVIDIKKIPAPHKIKASLDEYVVGQEQAKKVMSVAVYNHYKRIAADEKDGVEIEKSNMLMIGPTGCGKTYLVKTLARLLDVPLAITDATSLTEAGYIGDDIESVVSKLLAAADNDVERAEHGIIFIDEIDKIAKKRNTNQRDVSGESVQQGMLKLLEGAEVEVPVGASSKNAMVPMTMVNTKNILFICGGAFDGLEKLIQKRTDNASLGFGSQLRTTLDKDETRQKLLKKVEPDDLVKFGLIPELIGRLPVVTVLDPLDEEALVRVLTEPKNSIVRQYKELFHLDNAELVFTEDALHAIAKKTVERKSGARGLRSVVEELLIPIMYDIPSDATITKVTIDADTVAGGEPHIEHGMMRPRYKNMASQQ